jgi:demethylmenaquinone methyltransferase/2-methoxy-6-polyprenyl-1,4-benzoquinol methylase
MSIVFMRVLESAPNRYDLGIRLLTLGKSGGLYDWLTAHIQPGWRVLDVGTGTGAMALRAAERGAEVVGIDVDPMMMDLAREKAEQGGHLDSISWRELGVAETDVFPDASLDAVCAGLCLSELAPSERRYALGESRRLLRPRGLLLLLDEQRPSNPLNRLLYTGLRIPLGVLTWLVTQTSTQTLPDLVALVEASDFQLVEQRRALLSSLVAVVATPRRGAA